MQKGKRIRKIVALLGAAAMTATLLAGCGNSKSASNTGSDASDSSKEAAAGEIIGSDADKVYKIGFANSSLDNPWRIGIQNTIEKGFAKYSNVKLITNQADEDPIKMNNNIEDLISQDVDLIVACTVEAEPFETAADACEAAGVPLIVVDRGINSDNYTCYIKQSNFQLGYDAADWTAEQMEERYGSVTGKVVELQGVPGNLPAEERRESYHEKVEADYPGLDIVAAQPTDYSRSNAMEVMTNILQAQKEIDVVYTHEDEIALGCIKALQEAKRTEGVLVIGNGGSVSAIEAIENGEMAACMLYSPIDFGEIAVETVAKYLAGEEIDKVIEFKGGIVTPDNVAEYRAQLDASGEDFVKTITE